MKVHITLTKDDVLKIVKTPEYTPLAHHLTEEQLATMARKIEERLFLAENGASGQVVMNLIVTKFIEEWAKDAIVVSCHLPQYLYYQIKDEANTQKRSVSQHLTELLTSVTVLSSLLTPMDSAAVEVKTQEINLATKGKTKKHTPSYWHDKIELIQQELSAGKTRAEIARKHGKSVGSLKGFIRGHIKSKN